MHQYTQLSDAHVEAVGERVGEILERVGLLCQNEELLQALKAWGASVDMQTQRAWFPRDRVACFVADLREEAGRRVSAPGPFAAPGLPGLGCQIAQLYHDYPRRERRQGNAADLIRLIKLGSVLDGGSTGHSLVQAGVPPRLEALESAMLLAEYAPKPQGAFAWFVDQVDYLREMGEILGIENWFSWGAICFAHPLRFDKDVADKFARRVREGLSTGLTAMPVAGASTPVTVEGFTAVAAAEHVAGWITARALNPEVGLYGSMWAGTVDMKSGTVSYSAFDAMHYAFVSAEFLRRWTGVDVSVGGGEYCSAREPGLYTAIEKAYKAMMIAAFNGRHPGVGSGMLDDGKVICPVQLLVERDVAKAVRLLARPFEPTAERIGMDAIVEVGIGMETNHLTTRHALEHFRGSLWLPELIERAGWRGPESDRAMLDAAQGRVEELRAEYRKPEGREDKLAAMRKVVERARAHLLG